MIRIKQDYPVRGYQIPTFGLRELTNGELVDEDSKLGKALLNYFPSICVIEGESAPKVSETPVLLVEEPIAPASVEEVVEEEVPTPEAQVAVEETEETKPVFGRKGKK